MSEDDDQRNEQKEVETSRRDFLKGSAVAASAGLAATTLGGASTASAHDAPENPYGSRPGGGISLPEYYKPWPAIKNRNMYLPGTEILPKNEMRVTFLGSTPRPRPVFSSNWATATSSSSTLALKEDTTLKR